MSIITRITFSWNEIGKDAAIYKVFQQCGFLPQLIMKYYEITRNPYGHISLVQGFTATDVCVFQFEVENGNVHGKLLHFKLDGSVIRDVDFEDGELVRINVSVDWSDDY